MRVFWATAWIALAAPVADWGFSDAFGHHTFFLVAGWSILGGWLGGVLGHLIDEHRRRVRDDRHFRDDHYFRYAPGTRERAELLARHHRTACAAFEIERERREKAAMAVFRSHLTDDQRFCLDQHGYFFVRATSGAEYKVRREAIQNVELHQKDWFVQYCAVPKDGGHQWPLGDILLSQLLLLRYDEATFLAKAYKTVFDKAGTIAVQTEPGVRHEMRGDG